MTTLVTTLNTEFAAIGDFHTQAAGADVALWRKGVSSGTFAIAGVVHAGEAVIVRNPGSAGATWKLMDTGRGTPTSVEAWQ